jgi:hypothetical protein
MAQSQADIIGWVVTWYDDDLIRREERFGADWTYPDLYRRVEELQAAGHLPGMEAIR